MRRSSVRTSLRAVAGVITAAIGPVIAVAGVGWALRFVITREPATGVIRGQVFVENFQPIGDADVYLRRHGAQDARGRVRYVVSSEDGRFTFTQVPVGEYALTASSVAHEARESLVTVDEGGVTNIVLDMQRTQGDLVVKEHQRIFGSRERAHIAVTGYVTGGDPRRADSVHIRLFRTRLSSVLLEPSGADALGQVGRSYDGAPRLPDTLLDPTAGQPPAKVQDGDARLVEVDREGFYYQSLDFGVLPTGLYLLDLTHGSSTACAWLLVTDLALVVKQSPTQLLAYAVGMEDGLPVNGALITSFRAGRPVATARTDARGLATVAAKPSPAGGDDSGIPYATIAARGTDEAVVAGTGEFNEDAGKFAVFAYTDRPIYRPGQRVEFKAILRRIRDLDASAPLRYGPAPGLPVTVQMRDPSGIRILEQKCRSNGLGSIFGSCDLSAEGATGVYTLAVNVAGETHTHDVVVAAYRKPEFQVTVTPEKRRYVRGDTVTVRVTSAYYFGAPVAGAALEYRIYRTPDWSSQYPDDSGDDAEAADTAQWPPLGEDYYGQDAGSGTAVLDGNGSATIQFTTRRAADVDYDLDDLYTISVTVTEHANREVTADSEIRVSAGDFRLTVEPAGYLAAPGQRLRAAIHATDYDAKPVRGVAVELDSRYEWVSGHTRRRAQPKVLRLVTDSSGSAVATITPSGEGDLDLTARAVDRSGRRITGNAYVWVCGDGGADVQTEYADLSLLTDRHRYAPGSTARLLINCARTGQTVLVTVEGRKVYRAITVPIRRRSTVAYLPILSEYGPNISLSACYVRDKHFAQSTMVLRVPTTQQDLRVQVVGRHAGPAAPKALGAGSRFAPGDKIAYEVRVTDAAGHPVRSEISLGVVDEAIYALREDNPNALKDAFYPHRSDDVDTEYSFAVVYLGDADKAEPVITARRRFPDTAFWAPVIDTDSAGRARAAFTLPDNLTTWRATVTAQTSDTRLGRGTAKIIVSKPFMVRLEAPRFLTQLDRSRLVAVVHNETGAVRTAYVRLRAGNLEAPGPALRVVHLAAGEAGEVQWPVTAIGYGQARVRVTAWTARSEGPQFTDGVESSLPIRPHGRLAVTGYAGELTAASPETEVVRVDPNAVPGTARVTVRITPSVITAITGPLDYLTGFPYGCTEQTLSRILPDMLVQQIARTRAPGVHPPADVRRMVRDGILRLYRFQHRESGGWGWWEHDPDDAWMTAYALFGLATARSEGYAVDPGVIARGRHALIGMYSQVTPDDAPFVLYALDRCGATAFARHNAQALRVNALDPAALGYLIQVDRLVGASAAVPMSLLATSAVVEGPMVHWRARESFAWDDTEATAVALQAYLVTDPTSPRIPGAIRWLMTHRRDAYWDSTRDTCSVLVALCDDLKSQPAAPGTGEVRISLNGQPLRTYTLTPDVVQERELVLRIPAARLRPEKNDVMLERIGGSSTVFYAVQLRQTIAGDPLPALPQAGLRVARQYLRVVPTQDDQDSWQVQTKPTHDSLRVGDRIRVRLTLDAPRDMEYVIIEDPFPSGCEVTERGTTDDDTDWSFWYSSDDIRDDRIAFFATSLPAGRHVIEYNLRAQTPGTFRALPTLVQAMYEPGLRAESAEDVVQVR